MDGNTPQRYGHDFAAALVSRCNIAPWELASVEFQDAPRPIEIVGARQSEGRLFDLLDRIPSSDVRGATFHEYLAARFQIDQWSNGNAGPSVPLRHSYLRFLRGWGIDSNGRSGAVLKGWVESRFGLRPTYHGGILASSAAAMEKYLQDRMHGEAETMGIGMQLDLLFTYCQSELARRNPGELWATLYRGTHDPEEYALRSETSSNGSLVQLNNLSSFTSDPEIAWEFGSFVWEVRVPLAKIFFFKGLLPRNILDGEQEHLVLGGEYKVRRLVC